MDIQIEYGKKILPNALPEEQSWLVITTPPIKKIIEKKLKKITAEIVTASNVDENALEQWEQKLPNTAGVLGIGGGVCMDSAKFVAWKRDLPLWLAPSVISVDACLTETIAVRREGRVKYIGEVYPQTVFIDFDLIQSAPPNINRAGAGDILSIQTALWDWKLAAARTGEFYYANVAEKGSRLLGRLEDAADDIRHVTEQGIRELIELYATEVDMCQVFGNSRPEEGSEHFWAYNLEYRTKKNFIHGELVTLGVLLMTALQGNKPNWIRTFVTELGIRWRPDEIGVEMQELIESLTSAKAYVEEEELPFSVLNTQDISKDVATKIIEEVTKLG